ncbi:hypothetical protein AGLY_016928 [Aphis glycines]|uniref:MADF domain-containing protein n=1 Tax=Aphis glycines TaxID=307491 RepID=A0A6G0SX33_APHGL|nr:hypothetical protein AGLY_016928 [Aphis glycines]
MKPLWNFFTLYEKERLKWSPKDPLHKNRNAVNDELLARKLRSFDEFTREILMHDINDLIYRAKREIRNCSAQSHLPLLQHGDQYPSFYKNYVIPPYNHIISLSSSNSTMIHSINMCPVFSPTFSSYSSQNSCISQPSPNLNPYNSCQSIDTDTTNINQNESMEDNYNMFIVCIK